MTILNRSIILLCFTKKGNFLSLILTYVHDSSYKSITLFNQTISYVLVHVSLHMRLIHCASFLSILFMSLCKSSILLSNFFILACGIYKVVYTASDLESRTTLCNRDYNHIKGREVKLA